MSERRRKQRLFAKMLPRLIDKFYELGYTLSLGDAYRDERCNYGHQNSLHKIRLAIDLNVFKGSSIYPIKNGVEFKEVGEFWESLHTDNRWGGRFGESSPGAGDGWDGGHFSHTYGGMR